MDSFLELLRGLPIDFANVYIALLRVIAPVLMGVILWRAAKPLLTFRKEPEIWAMLRLEDGKVNEWFIEIFVKQITPLPGDRFAWVLDLAPTRQTVICTVDGQKKYPRVSLESNLFKGVWSAPDLPRGFLLDEAGAVNGDISAEMFGHDRLPSRTPADFSVGLARRRLRFEDAHAFQKAHNSKRITA